MSCFRVLLACLLLTGCMPLPRPFQPDDKSAPQHLLLAPKANDSILVVPVHGVPGPESEQLAEAVANALRTREIPASTRTASRISFLLQGETRPYGILWRLIDPAGLTVATTEQTVQAGNLNGTAEQAAALVERLVRKDMPPPGVDAPRVVLGDIQGAPGDGAVSLRRAMRAILKRQQVEVLERPADGVVSIGGAVRLADLPNGAQLVEIEWIVLDEAGNRVASVGQRNAVPRGRLDGPWGEIAVAAAEGGAEGLLQILNKIGPRGSEESR